MITAIAAPASASTARDPTLPTGWHAVRLGSLAALRGETVDPSAAGNLPYVGLEHIDSASPSLRRWGSPEEVTSAKSKFMPGDLLYGKLRPYLDKAVFAEFEGICSTDILVVRPTEADGHYLAYFVHTVGFLQHAIKTMRGVNHPRTSWSSLAEFEVQLPPLDQQQVVVKALQAVQQAIESRQHEAELERERKAALMQHLFTYGVRDDGDGLLDTKYGAIPARWQVMALTDCAHVQTGVAKGRQFNGESTLDVPYLRVANVQDGYLDLSEMKTITIAEREMDRYRLKTGDVVVTEGGDFDKLGRGYIWQGQVENCVHQNHVFAVRVRPDVVLPEYLAYLVQSAYGRGYFLSVAHKTTNLACINSAKLKAMPVPVPDVEEQRSIVEALDACDSKLVAVQKEQSALDELFRTILEELMTGRLSTS